MVCIFCTFLFLCLILYIVQKCGVTRATNVQCLVLLQKRVIRLLYGAKRLDHTNLLFYNLRILKVDINVSLYKTMHECISVKGVKIWNFLDSSLISCRNIHQFKKQYTDKILNSYVLES